MTESDNKRRWLVPEVIQSSAMDCGPAVLKCLLDGFYLNASYGRLREACQTSVDGTSIDVIETVAQQLGLAAEQIMLPADFLWLRQARVFPAIVVTQQNDGTTHFVVVWRRVGRWLQVMDPAIGRQWISINTFSRRLLEHRIDVDASDWWSWANDDEAKNVFIGRLRALGATPAQAQSHVTAVYTTQNWRLVAAFDAALRFASALRDAGVLRQWKHYDDLLNKLVPRTVDTESVTRALLPERFWAFTPAAHDDAKLTLKGAVLLRVAGRSTLLMDQGSHATADAGEADIGAVLRDEPIRPARELWKLVRAEGVLTPFALTLAIGIAMGALVVEALLFRGIFDLAHEFNVTSQRLIAFFGLSAFVLMLWFLELSLIQETLRLGRHLEARLRVALMTSLPKLNDRYLQSRPVSDMAERGHSIYAARDLPEQVASFMRTAWELLFTLIGIGFIAPHSLPLAASIAVLTLIVLAGAQPVMSERDLRVRSHLGSLKRFYLDALIGIVPIRSHAAERSVQREHEGLLVEWARSAMRPLRLTISIELLRAVGSLTLTAWLLYLHIRTRGVTGDLLLLVYWVLKLPALGEQLVATVLQYPMQRSICLRLLELVKSSSDSDGNVDKDAAGAIVTADSQQSTRCQGRNNAVTIDMQAVNVVAGGHNLLTDIDLHIAAGEHIAIVGPSGAGKSSLLGLLLGFYAPADAAVIVDGKPLMGDHLSHIRRHTAWVDPAVRLWNRSLLENLQYSPHPGAHEDLGHILESADLLQVLAHLPEGLQCPLNDGGARLSGGEGQRVRLARAMWQRDVRLALLDEPFRGLDRTQRRRQLNNARKFWRQSTMICVTHDVAETTAFERVIVVDGGRIIEDDTPQALSSAVDSRYRQMLDAEERLQRHWWRQNRLWRRMQLDGGKLQVVDPPVSM